MQHVGFCSRIKATGICTQHTKCSVIGSETNASFRRTNFGDEHQELLTLVFNVPTMRSARHTVRSFLEVKMVSGCIVMQVEEFVQILDDTQAPDPNHKRKKICEQHSCLAYVFELDIVCFITINMYNNR